MGRTTYETQFEIELTKGNTDFMFSGVLETIVCWETNEIVRQEVENGKVMKFTKPDIVEIYDGDIGDKDFKLIQPFLDTLDYTQKRYFNDTRWKA